jgi:hypothetical protein
MGANPRAGWDASDDVASEAAVKKLTAAMWGTFIPMGCLGALASWLRLRHFQRNVLEQFKQVWRHCKGGCLLSPQFCMFNFNKPGRRHARQLARPLDVRTYLLLCREYGDVEEMSPLDAYVFTDSRFVEVLARCCRVWINPATLDPAAIKLADTVVKVLPGLILSTQRSAACCCRRRQRVGVCTDPATWLLHACS